MEWSGTNSFKNFRGADSESKSIMDMTIISNIDPVDVRLPPSEDSNVVTTIKPKKKTMTSVYLKFFETAPDGKSRRCKFCGQGYSMATATGNLGRHLSNRHPGYDMTGDAMTNSSLPSVTIVKKPQPQAKAPQVDLDHLNWLLIKWLILASLPPSTLEEKWLENSFKFLNSSVQLWSGDKFRAVLHEIFWSMQEDVRATLEEVSSKVSITLDFWTSFEQIFYMSVTCQWIDDNWSFQKVLLNICHIPSPCGGSEIYHKLVKVLKLYNIHNRVLSCTHDNNLEVMLACRTLKEDIDSPKMGPFWYVPCAARALNSIIDDGLRTTKPIISKIREVILEVNASAEMTEELVEYTITYNEGSWKFPLDASSRWSGSYQMLDFACKASKSMECIIRKHEDTLGKRLLLNSAEKNAINIMHTFLEPFHKTTVNICTNRVPTVGLVIFFMDHISETISSCGESRHSPDWLKTASHDMATKTQKYTDQVSNIFAYMTAILDPRIKVELLPESLNLEKNLAEARGYFIRNYSSTHFPSISSGYGALDMEDDGGSVSFAEEIARKKRRVNISSSDELTQYLSESPAPISTNVFEWWKANSTRYPRLSLMARDFLAVQATSVAPEELFCCKGNEIDKQRYCVAHDSTQALLCIKSWTEGGMKLKYKSTEIDYERLMELAATAASENGSAGFDKKLK